MGVIIYELCTLKKPFDGKSITEVFDAIKNKPIDPLPKGTSLELQMLVKSILNKEKDRRPSIFDVAKIPCVSNKII
jgi:NIMA (never in mitosis gene a)-related kinase